MFHRSWGIMMIQRNITAPCTVLDFPTLEKFERELRENQYDVVGITSIIANVGKVREMCKRIRRISPQATIIVGGHVAAVPGLSHLIDADHIVKGEGIAWMRHYLGEDESAAIEHPPIVSGFRMRIMGIPIPDRRGAAAATIIPSVGCPMGCNFCTTSAFFGGKGKAVHFLKSGDELFATMQHMEQTLGVQSFFVMDENFLLNRRRAMELLDLMRAGRKSWALYVFSSMNAIRQYTIQELVELGVSWVWMGLESPNSKYEKLNGANTIKTVDELRHHGIKLLGSTIVGLEHHTPENVKSEIEYAIDHGTDFHQFMLYTPVPGTPLHQQMTEENRMLNVDPADIHGQLKFNFLHTAISRDESKRFLDWAFFRDFERNGPSLFRICRTMLEGWKRYKDHPDERVRRRFEMEVEHLRTTYNAALWVMEKRLKSPLKGKIRRLRREVEAEFGAKPRLTRSLLGPIMYFTSKWEDRRLAKGRTYEPPTFIERLHWA